MPRMKATVDQKFAGHRVEAGEIIEATDREAKLLVLLRRATPVGPEPIITKIATTPRAPRAKRDPQAPKRAYRRRDMRAEG